MNKKSKVVRYNKWGYIFLLPFIAVFLVFQLIPLVTTIYNSFFLHMEDGLTEQLYLMAIYQSISLTQ